MPLRLFTVLVSLNIQSRTVTYSFEPFPSFGLWLTKKNHHQSQLSHLVFKSKRVKSLTYRTVKQTFWKYQDGFFCSFLYLIVNTWTITACVYIFILFCKLTCVQTTIYRHDMLIENNYIHFVYRKYQVGRLSVLISYGNTNQ